MTSIWREAGYENAENSSQMRQIDRMATGGPSAVAMTTPSPAAQVQPGHLELGVLVNWTNANICHWLHEIGAGEAQTAFQHHNIQGPEMIIMNKEDLKYMQVPLGAALRISLHLEEVALAKSEADDRATIIRRMQTISTWKEYFGPCHTEFFCGDKDYKMTGTAITSTLTEAQCDCSGKHVDNIDFSRVTDIDNMHPGFTLSDLCCGERGYVVVKHQNGELLITMEREQSAPKAAEIRETWEMAQLQMVGRR